MKPKLRTLLLALVTLVALAGFALLLFTVGKTAPLPPLPSPNGYEDIIKAGNLVSREVDFAHQMRRDELRAFIATNALVLQQLRVGLSRTCSVPLEVALSTNAFFPVELGAIKRLARLLNGEGQLAELENRPADAARSYLDAIRLGNETSRGGFLLHRSVGISCEAVGYFHLVKVVPQLNSEQSRPLLADLEKADNQAVSWGDVLRGEKVFLRHSRRQALNPINRVVAWWQSRLILERTKARHNVMTAQLCLLTTELALRCYQVEQGHVPERLDQLAPKYLQCVPLDPFARQPLIYRPQGTSWLLYSVGLDGVDEGGKRTGKLVSGSVATGDVFFDSLIQF